MKDFGSQSDAKGAQDADENVHIALEPRIAFDAAMAAEAIDAVEDRTATIETSLPTDTGQDIEALSSGLGQVPDGANHVVFVDPSLPDLDQLISDIPSAAEVIFLDPERDGAEQLHEALEARAETDAVHILAHGAEGSLQLGSSVLTTETIEGTYADTLSAIGGMLNDQADIFIYGCDFGADETAVAALADATGADVAASDDVTGAAQSGGDWELEVEVGTIDHSALAAAEWSGTLAPGDFDDDGVPDDEDADDDNDGILDTDSFVSVDPSDPSVRPDLFPSGFSVGDDITTDVQAAGGLGGFAPNTGNEMTVSAELFGSARFRGGVDLVSVSGIAEVIQFQPDRTSNFDISDPTSGNAAVYTFEWDLPIRDLNLDVGGLNNADTVVFRAFNGTTEVPITAANIQLLDTTPGPNGQGLVRLAPNAVVGNANDGGTGVTTNNVRLVLPDEITRIELATGKNSSSSGTVTLGVHTLNYRTALDSDGDGNVDHRDIDSDNDGITDNVEAQSTAGYIAPSGQGTAIIDGNGDGVDDNYAGGLTPVDTDGDGVADYLDDDSDADGIPDVAERADGGPTSASGADTDGDGLLDVFEGASATDGVDVNDENIVGDNGGADGDYTRFAPGDTAGGTNANEAQAGRTSNDAVAGVIDLDFRDGDTDNDGVNDMDDIDDDNDGILDTDELAQAITAAREQNQALQSSGIVATSSGISNQTPGSIAIYALEDPANPGVTIGYLRATLTELSDPDSRLDWRFSGVSGGQPSALLRANDNDTSTDETATIKFELFGLGDTPASLVTGAPGTDPLRSNFNATVGDVDGPPSGRTEFVRAELGALSAYTVEDGGDLTTSETEVPGQVTVTGTVNNPDDLARFEYVATQAFELTVGTNRANAGYAFDLSGSATFTDPITTIVGVDSDGDGFDDNLDIDKDHDGITDNVEAQTTAGYIAPTGNDADGDGLDDAYDDTPNTGAAGSNGLTEVDTDGDGVTDTLDQDSDGDGIDDVAERGDGGPSSVPATFTDTDGDGLLDEFEGSQVSDRFDVNDENLDPADTNFLLAGDPALDADGGNAIPLGLDLDYRDTTELEDDIASTEEDVPVTVNVLGNDDINAAFDPTDPGSGATLTMLDGAGNPVSGPLVVPGEGTYEVVDVSGTPQIRFTPAPGFTGTAGPVSYGVVTGGNVIASAELSVLIDASPDPADDTFVGAEDTDLPLDILGNDDVGNGLASVTIDTIPPAAEGVLQYTDAGGNKVDITAGTVLTPAQAATLTFVPASDFFSPVTPFDYTITDIDGDTGSATVNITIDGAPEPQPDVITVTEDTPTPVDIASNDDGGEPPFTFSLDSVPPTSQGTLTYTDAGTGNTITVDPNNPPSDLSEAEASSLIFTPTPGYTGPVDPIAYTVTDDDGDSASSTATLTIDPVPDPVADVLTTPEDTPLDLPILDNDDVGDGLAAVVIDTVPAAAQGTLSYIDASGIRQTIASGGTTLTPAEAATLRFDPASDFVGPVTQIGYTVEDTDGDTASTTVDITVDGLPDLSQDAVQTQENTPVALDPLANDPDFGDGFDSATIDTVPPSSQGTLTYVDDTTGATITVAAGATLSETEMATLGFTPATGFNGSVDPISYTVRDTDGDEASTTIDVAVAAIVEANDDTLETPQDTPIMVNPLANDDPGGPDAVVAITSVPPAAQGTLTYVDASGATQTLSPGDAISTSEFATLVFTPTTGFVGPVDPIDYTISDPLGNTDSATIDLLVDGIPDAADDVISGEEDTPLPLDLLSNDNLGDPPGSVRIDTVPAAAQGTLTYTDAAGATQTVSPGDILTPTEASSLVFEPASGFNGDVDAFGYTVIDVDGDTSSAEVSLSIDAVPDLVADVFVVPEDVEAALPILDNDDLGDGVDTVTIDSLPPSSEGVLQYVDASGATQPVVAGAPLSAAEIATLSFDPAPDFFGPVTRFSYTVTDTDGDVDTTTVDIRVDGLPEPANDVFSTDEDTPVVINIVANDDLGDGPATVALDSVPPTSQGTLTYTDEATGNTVTIDPNNPPTGLAPVELATLTFTPVADFDGTVDPIAYTITDADGDTASSVATIVINATPDPVADTIATDEDTPVALDLVANDDAGDGLASLTIDTLPNPTDGTLTYTDASGAEQPVAAGVPLNPAEAATIVFTPAANFNGTVPAIPYTITDLSGDSASSTVSIAVDAVPDPIDDTVTTPEDTPVAINVLADNGAGTDDLGDGLGSVRIDRVPSAAQGTLTYTDSSGGTQTVTAGTVLDPSEATTLVFSPATGFNGPVATIPYTIIDSDGDTGTADLNITVDGLPDLSPDVFVGGPNETLATNFIANDIDFGDGLRFVTIPTAPDPVQGVLTYVEDVTGTTITVADGEELSETEMATLEFNPEDTFFGAVDPITYTVTDIDGDEASSTANIFIDAATDVANDDLLTKEDTPIDLNLLDNDEIADPASTVTIGAVIPDPATEGVLTYVDDITGNPVQIAANDTLSVTELATIRFEPVAGFTGTATSFDYTVTASPAGGGVSDTAGVTIVVDPVPEAVNDVYATDEDTAVAIPVNDNDDNGTGFASVQFTLLPTATEGVVEYQPGGTGGFAAVTTSTVLTAAEAATLRFTPAADFSGDVATFQYRLTDAADPDGVQDSDLADVDIFVDAVPDPVNDAVAVDEDTPVDIDILGNDDPGDGVASVTFTNVPPASAGTLTYVDASGNRQPVTAGAPLSPDEAASLQFTPVPDFDGAIPVLNYELTDTNGDVGTATLTLTMNPTPDADPDAYLTKEDTPIAIDPTVNDLDAGDPASSVTLTTPPAAQGILSYETTPGDTGTRVNLPAGAASPSLTQAQFATLIFTPTADFAGPVDAIPYTVTDGDGDTVTTTISIEVDAVPDPVDDAITVDEDTPTVFSVIGNDDQGDGPATVTFSATPDPSAGVLTYLSDTGVVTPVTPGVPISSTEAGLITFTPAPDFNGPIPAIGYTLTDANGDTGTATLTLTMNPVPDVASDAAETDEDTPVDIDPLVNDPDLGDGPSTVAITAPPAAQGTISYETTPGDSGTRVDITADSTLAGLTPAQVSTLRFTPTPDFDGLIDPIPYTVTDNTGDTATANIFVAINPLPDPVADVAEVETGIPFDLDVLGNDDLGDGLDSLRFDSLPPAGQGTLTVLDGGTRRPVALNEPLSPALAETLQFDPAAGYLGTVDQFTYVVRDTSGDEAGTTVDLFVDPAPLPQSDVSDPTANGTPVTIDVVANDSLDPRGDVIDPTTVQIFGTSNPGDPFTVPGEGTWTVNPTTGALTFTPQTGFVGDPTPVLYTVEDDDGRRSVPVAVLADYVPVAEDDAETNLPPGPATIDVLANDVTGDAIVPGTVQIVGTANPGDPLVVPGEGTWTVNRFTGAITFTPEAGYTLDPTPIQYFGEDDQGNVSGPANVVLDYAPVAQPDVIGGIVPGEVVVFDVISNDTLGDAVDPNSFQFVGTTNPGDPLVVPGEGTYTYDPATGTVTFTPEPGFADVITPIAYTIADDEGNRTDPVSFTIEYLLPNTDEGDDVPDDLTDDDIDQPQLVVDPIIHDTATSLISLNANEILFGDFPILTAINGLFSLGGTTVLPTTDVPVFGGLEAPYPITMAVEDVDPGFIVGEFAGLAEPLLESLHHKSNPQATYYFLLGENRILALETTLSEESASLRINAVSNGIAGADIQLAAPDRISLGDALMLEEGYLRIERGAGDLTLPIYVQTDAGDEFDGELVISFADQSVAVSLSPASNKGFTGEVDAIASAGINEIAALKSALL